MESDVKMIEKIQQIIEGLSMIDQDTTVPKSARIKIKKAMEILENECEKNLSLKIDRSLQELGDLAEDPKLPQYTRMQIWSVVSLLESN